MPFALVAVVLLLSASISATFAALNARDEASWRAQEARLDALDRVADLVHEEVESQARNLAVAVLGGSPSPVNASRIPEAFREAFDDYIGTRFPRTVRSVHVRVDGYDVALRLANRRTEEAAPPDATRVEVLDGIEVSLPDPTSPEAWVAVDRLAYHEVVGSVNYTLALEGVTVRRSDALHIASPVPLPFLLGKAEQAARAGVGDVWGIGRTVKAILATLAQFRVLSGFASPANGDTTTADVIARRDVELAVNFALRLEEVRRFRTFDPAAAEAVDAARDALSWTGDAALDPERTLGRLLERYAANGTVDAVDAFVLYVGLDGVGVPVGAVFAQAISALVDDAALKHLDYLGLTPLADWVFEAGGMAGEWFDGFLRWISGRPSARVEYVHQYVRALFAEAGAQPTFFGPASLHLPALAYAVANGSGTTFIEIPAHTADVPFPTRHLLDRTYDAFWEAYFPRFNATLAKLDVSLRGFVSELAARVADDAVLAGLLPASALARVDPKDTVSFLDGIGERVRTAVDTALDRLRDDPDAMDSLTAHLWDAAKDTIADLVEHLAASYGTLVDLVAETTRAEDTIVADLLSWATLDSDYTYLNESARQRVRGLIADDVRGQGWPQEAVRNRRAQDEDAWWRVAESSVESPDPATPTLRARIREAAIGSAGWLRLARDSIVGIVGASESAQEAAGLRAVYATTLSPFRLRSAGDPTSETSERFRVVQVPPFLREDDLGIVIRDPSTLPPGADSPNVHYTRPHERSHRPFATRWTVHVRGAVTFRVETATPVLLGPEGPVPASVERELPIDLTLSLHAYSGWNLTGVRYHASNTWLGDAWEAVVSFVEAGWTVLVEVARAVLDLLRRAWALVMDLLDPLLAFGERVVRLLVTILEFQVALLHRLVMGAVQVVGGIADAVARGFGPGERLTIHAHGFAFMLAFLAPGGRTLELRASLGAGAASMAVVDLPAAGVLAGDARWDLLAGWTVDAPPFGMAAAFDPLAALQAHMIEGAASWDGAWAVELDGPHVETLYVARASFGVSDVPTPIGVAVDVEVGVEAAFARDPMELLSDLLWRSFQEAAEAIARGPWTWDGLGRFVELLGERLLANVLRALDDVMDVQVYVDVQAKAAAAAGLGFRLAFAADGVAVRDMLLWLVRNVIAFFTQVLDPLAPAEYASLPRSVAEHVYVRVVAYGLLELPEFVRRVAPMFSSQAAVGVTVQANVPTFGLLFGSDWGRWEVGFGAYARVVLGTGGLPTTAIALVARVWLLRGTLHGL